LKKLNFFREFSLTELNEILHSTQWLEYEPGSPVITEGEIDDSFYIIVMGGVMVKKGEKPLAKLKPGDCFGEMAYLGQIKRTASIQAISKSILMKINASIIQATSNNTQLLFFKVFSETLIRRLTQTNRLLASMAS
jgi:serine/threonine-protein kinase